MIKLPHLTGFEGLLDLDRRGVDIKPTLLRVITDQYLHAPTHTPDQERQYTELALRLLDETDIVARAAVSARLAPHACAPRAIILQLAHDVLEVADPVLRLSPRLTQADLDAIATERGASYAEIIRGRGPPEPLPAPVAPPLAPPPRRPVTPKAPPPKVAGPVWPKAPPHAAPLRQEAATPATNAGSAEPAEPGAPVVAQTPISAPTPAVAASAPAAADSAGPKPDREAQELCELFFAAGPIERRLIITGLDYLPTTPPELPATLQRSEVWKLESAALQHNTDAVVRDLRRMLGISHKQARRIVNDEMGEPIVVAAKAPELPADMVQRMLLFMNPVVGQSVDRVYELASLYCDFSVEAARHLIAILRNADPPDGPAARHETRWRDAVEEARQALSDIRHAPAARRDVQLARPAERTSGPDPG